MYTPRPAYSAGRGVNFQSSKRIGKIEGVTGFDLGMRVIVACRGGRDGRVNNPCTIQKQTKTLVC